MRILFEMCFNYNLWIVHVWLSFEGMRGDGENWNWQHTGFKTKTKVIKFYIVIDVESKNEMLFFPSHISFLLKNMLKKYKIHKMAAINFRSIELKCLNTCHVVITFKKINTNFMWGIKNTKCKKALF